MGKINLENTKKYCIFVKQNGKRLYLDIEDIAIKP
jgi:hypothetical protein